MKLAYNVLRPEIPKPAKIFGWILVIAGCFFAYVYMVSPGLYSTGVRILGSVLGIVLALVLNSSALLALMLATRVFIELGDVIVGLVINNGVPDTNTATLTILAAVEIFFIVLLARHINNTSAGQVA
jgi:hypothetical protein